MRLDLFGFGTKSRSWAITAQKRINCYVETRRESDKTNLALIGRPGLAPFVSNGANLTRGMWAINSLTTPQLFMVQGDVLYSVNAAGTVTAVGTLLTSTGNVSMADDGAYLVIVDGTYGYYYNLSTAVLTRITDANFTTTPTAVTWQDTYFIVSSAAATKQFQLSANANPASWPAVNINFVGVQGGKLQSVLSDHSIIHLFGDVYTTFYQNVGTADFPLAAIPGSAQQFGLAAAQSLEPFDNSLVGLFKDSHGNVNVSRLSGFALKKISDSDIDQILQSYSSVADAQAFSFASEGHPFYVINFESVDATWMYDGVSGAWTQLQSTDGSAFWPNKSVYFVNKTCVSDRRNGNIYILSPTVYDDDGEMLAMEIWSKHIYSDGKYIGINYLYIDLEAGTGTATGQGSNPQLLLEVSKDGGNSFFSVGYSTIGAVGEYTQRVIWTALGSARDWVLKLRITDPVRRVIVGAGGEVRIGSY